MQVNSPKHLTMPFQLSHEAHDAAKVFKGKYKSALKKMRSMPHSLPVGEETASKAREL